MEDIKVPFRPGTLFWNDINAEAPYPCAIISIKKAVVTFFEFNDNPGEKEYFFPEDRFHATFTKVCTVDEWIKHIDGQLDDIKKQSEQVSAEWQAVLDQHEVVFSRISTRLERLKQTHAKSEAASKKVRQFAELTLVGLQKVEQLNT